MQISGIQLFWIIFTYMTGNTLVMVAGPTIASTHQDAWICDIIAALVGMAITFMSSRICMLYPQKTLIEFSQSIVGRWIGKAIVIPYLIQWYLIVGIILRQFSDFTLTRFFHDTPEWVLILTMFLVVVYLTYSVGIEGIGRYSEIVGPLIFVALLAVFILSIPISDVHKLLPIYADSGARSIVRGTLFPAAFFGESVLLMMIIPFMNEPRLATRRAISGMVVASSIVCASTIFVLVTLGPNIASKLISPFFGEVRLISFLNFIQNLDSVLVLIYIVSVLVKLSLYFFAACYGTAQWLHVKKWRRMIWFIAPLELIYSVFIPNVDRLDIDALTKYAFWINAITIPLVLFTVVAIRKRGASK